MVRLSLSLIALLATATSQAWPQDVVFTLAPLPPVPGGVTEFGFARFLQNVYPYPASLYFSDTGQTARLKAVGIYSDQSAADALSDPDTVVLDFQV